MSAPLRLAINGYGRIGRCFLRALRESGRMAEFEIVAINEPSALPALAHLTRFDSTHGPFPGKVSHDDHHLIVDGKPIAVWHEREPEAVPWRELDIDILVECSGQYANRADLERFLHAGCRRVLLSNPGRSAADVDATVVFGVNHQDLHTDARIVSAASCTTNAVVPVLERIHRSAGIEHVFLTTLHSVMNDQPLLDGYHSADLRYTRSAIQSFVPVPTGLARGVERLLPELQGKVLAKAIRVPTLNVSSIDVMLQTRQPVTQEGINAMMAQASAQSPELFGYTDCAQASADFNHCSLSTVFDASQTRINGPHLLNVLVWFDNEWGFANRLVDVARYWRAQAR